jgi:hypothetical protein
VLHQCQSLDDERSSKKERGVKMADKMVSLNVLKALYENRLFGKQR